MRGTLVILFMVVLVVAAPVSALGSDYSASKPDQYGVYLYFSGMLNNLTRVFGSISGGENDSLQLALGFYNLTNTTYGMVLRYSPYGIDPSSVELSRLFLKLGRGTFEVALGYLGFRGNFSRGNYLGARAALAMMKTGMDDCGDALSELGLVELKGENGGTLRFDVRPLLDQLDSLEALFESYRANLEEVVSPKNFTLFASKLTPYATENVTFFGFAPGLSSVRLVVDNYSYRVNVSNSSFTFVFSFRRPGLYRVYATALNGSELVSSNVLMLNVSRVPSRILVVEGFEKGVVVRGYLLDYRGSGISGREVCLSFNGTRITKTSENGSFVFHLGDLGRNLNLSVYFRGDDVYLPSNHTLTLTPIANRPTIKLFASERVEANSEFKVGIEVDSLRPIPVKIYVDGKPNRTVYGSGNLTAVFRLPPGEHEIYARFSGGYGMLPSGSNVITVKAGGIDYLRSFMLFLTALILSGVFYRLLSWRGEGKPESGSSLEMGSAPEIEGDRFDLRTAYRFVFHVLRKLYGLPRSVTPRELLSALHSRSFFGDLRFLTELHERAVYGGFKVSAGEVLEAIKRASRIVVSAIVGEEL
ncbi:DUF4129 domain-containing protein [Thermococcus sp.]|uniref:DUF4129 domain-containing protein n=1 Tax=Thermococcus sp. TaxID=35749 RepID=UPI00263834A9|nr:DUF4129 domain-containing protein [Thermococcus sp.]